VKFCGEGVNSFRCWQFEEFFQLIIAEMGFHLGMSAKIRLVRVRDLAKSKMLELQPLAGEEMTLPQTDTYRSGFIDGERTLAAQILALLDKQEAEVVEPLEDEMILSLGRT